MILALAVKMYWRRPHPEGLYHCFRKDRAQGGYVSLCGRARIPRPYGQDRNRPRSIQRCPRCDGGEAAVHGKDEGLPDNVTCPNRPLH